MPKAQKQKSSIIRESVFKWYSNPVHKQDCDAMYDIARSEKINDIYEKITEDSERDVLFAKTDLLVLTANTYEQNILHALSYLETNEKIKELDIMLNSPGKLFNRVSAYSFSLSGYTVMNIHSRVTGAYTNGGAADVIRYALSNEYLFPAAVISFGICFGTKEHKSSLGEVVLSRKVYPYFIGAKVKGEQLAVTDDNMFSICDNLAKALENLERKNQLNKTALGFDVTIGNYITGEAVVSSEKYRERYKKITTQPIDAGDMEAYGVFKECNTLPYSIPCIVLKSICDWGIEKNYDLSDRNVIEDYCKIVLNCSVDALDEERRIMAVDTIGSLMDRIQAYAASHSFEVLKVLLNNYSFAHSSLNIFKDTIKHMIENTDFKGEIWTNRRLKQTIEKNLCEYHYAVPDSYVTLIAKVLADEGVIQNLEETKCASEEVGFVFEIAPITNKSF